MLECQATKLHALSAAPMQRDTAQQIIVALVAASATLNDSIDAIRGDVPDSEFRDYRRRAAQVMAAIYLDLIKPIVASYPDLDPGGDKDY